MPTFEKNGPGYQVHLSGVIAKSLRGIQTRANLLGRGKEVLSTFKAIVHRLEHDPFDFGEPLYRLPALRLQVRHGALRSLFVD